MRFKFFTYNWMDLVIKTNEFEKFTEKQIIAWTSFEITREKNY